SLAAIAVAVERVDGDAGRDLFEEEALADRLRAERHLLRVRHLREEHRDGMRDIGRRFRDGGKERRGDEYDGAQRSLQHAMIKSLMSASLTDGPDDAESPFVLADG